MPNANAMVVFEDRPSVSLAFTCQSRWPRSASGRGKLVCSMTPHLTPPHFTPPHFTSSLPLSGGLTVIFPNVHRHARAFPSGTSLLYLASALFNPWKTTIRPVTYLRLLESREICKVRWAVCIIPWCIQAKARPGAYCAALPSELVGGCDSETSSPGLISSAHWPLSISNPATVMQMQISESLPRTTPQSISRAPSRSACEPLIRVVDHAHA